jgi:hypothetical protein
VIEQPGSPEWWRRRLMDALDKQCKRVAMLEQYYDGDHPLPDPPRSMSVEALAEARANFKNLCRMGKTNFVRMISQAKAERLKVRGFRFGAAVVPDADAWKLWQANHLDSDSQLLLETVFSTGQAYGLVWPSNLLVDGAGNVEIDPSSVPTMTFEHPSEMIVAYAAGSRRRRVAALKRWKADDGRLMVTLYTPAAVYKWQSRSTRPEYGLAMGDMAWIARDTVITAATLTDAAVVEPWPLLNPLGVVPVIEFAINTGLRARPFGGGVSEFAAVLTIQDRINKTVFDRLVTGESQAFKQRYTIGWEPPVDPVTKEPDPRAVYRASQSRLWTFSGSGPNQQDVQVGEFGQADFTGFIKGKESDVNDMATITTTPPHYLLGAMINISGDALAAAESGHVSQVKARAVVLDDPMEEFIRLGLLAAGNAKGAADEQSMVLWDDVERRTWGEKIDGLVKLKALGVPNEELWAMVPDVSPQDVDRWIAKVAAMPPLPPEPAPVPAIP